ECRGEKSVIIQQSLQLLRDCVICRVLQLHFPAGLFQFNRFIKVVSQGRLEGCDLFDRSELNPAPGLRMFANPFENSLRIPEQSALEKRERARIAQRNDNRYILLLEGETGLAPLELFRQEAVEGDLAELIRLLLPF